MLGQFNKLYLSITCVFVLFCESFSSSKYTHRKKDRDYKMTIIKGWEDSLIDCLIVYL